MASTLDRIKITEQTIGNALTTELMVVPANQREFSWKEKHVEDLYRDFSIAIEQGAQEYFLGSIVVIRSHRDGKPQVVDGQQRLATSLILLAAIRDYMAWNNLPNVDVNKFQDRFVLSSHYMSPTQKEARLTLNERDREHFVRRILLPSTDQQRIDVEKAPKRSTPRPPLSHRLINRAADIAKSTVAKIVKDVAQEKRADELNKWVDFLLKKARVIWVEVPDESSAYLIFETMNDRGLELSASDLIKNYLFSKAGSDEKLQTIKQNWAAMVNVLNTAPKVEVKDFVRHFWIVRNGVVRSPDLFVAIRDNVKNDIEAVEISERLSQSAILYVGLMTPGSAIWKSYPEEVKRAIATLNVLGVEQHRPLLMAAMETFNTKEMAKLLIECIIWSVRMLVVGIQGSGAAETGYSNAAVGIYEKKYRKAAEVSAAMSKYVPTDAQFEAAFSEFSVSKAAIARYYLQAMEASHQSKPEPYLASDTELGINREHIMPEKRSENWHHISVSDHEEYVSRMGNFVLLKITENSEAGGDGYADKRTILKGSKFALTKQAAQADEWDITDIEKRQKELAQIALKTWPLKK